MKILMMSHYFPTHKGGIEVIADELFRSLTARGQKVTWLAGGVTPPPPVIGDSRAVPIPVFNFVEDKIGVPLPIPAPGAFSRIGHEVRDAEVLILQDCLYLTNILGFFSARRRGVPIVIIQHIGLVPYRNPLLNVAMKLGNKIFTERMLSQATQVVFYSEVTRKFYSHLHFRHPPEMILNGVDTSLYGARGGPEERLALRDKFGLPCKGTVVLFVGRFVEKKGIPAIRRMTEQRSDWTWVFAGAGPLDPGRWNFANVHVFSNLRGPSLAPLYRTCDLLILPSIGEGFPLVVQEALASGLPIVCSTETLAADPAIEPYVVAAPVFPGDRERTAAEFLTAIGRVIESDAGSELKCEQRRAFAASRYSWDHAAEQYVRIVSRLAPEPRSAGSAANPAEKEGEDLAGC